MARYVLAGLKITVPAPILGSEERHSVVANWRVGREALHACGQMARGERMWLGPIMARLGSFVFDVYTDNETARTAEKLEAAASDATEVAECLERFAWSGHFSAMASIIRAALATKKAEG